MTDHEIKADFVVNSDSVIDKQQAAIDKHEVEIVRAMRDAIQDVPVCSDQAYYEARKIFRAICALNIAAVNIQTREYNEAQMKSDAAPVSELNAEEQAAFDRSIQEADIAEKLAAASVLDAPTTGKGSRKGKVSKLDGQGVTGEVSALDAEQPDPAAAARADILGTPKE